MIADNLSKQPTQPDIISEMAESCTEILLDSAEAEVPPAPRRNPKLGWCESAETLAALSKTWDARDKARRRLRTKPREKMVWKMLKTTCAYLLKVVDARVHRYRTEYVAQTERLLADNDQLGFFKLFKCTAGLKGQKARSEQFIVPEDSMVLREKVHVPERWVEFFHTLLNNEIA